MSELDGTQATALQRPLNGDKEAWKAYWLAQGQPWRTEPEINTERQKYLAERRSITPDIQQGIYPFKDIKLSRADVEWLLSTHENGRGPVDWSDEEQREREGLDLRGADLSQVDLSNLPLARFRGGLDKLDWDNATKGQRQIAAVLMKGANLQEACLGGAILRKANLEEAFMVMTYLEKADLAGAHLEGANFDKAHLDGANLQGVFFNEGTYMQDVSLGNKKLGFVSLGNVRWGDVNLAGVKWSQMEMLGEEHKARQKKHEGKVKDRDAQLEECEIAVRANRQLAVALRNQGLNEEADHFAYRAQKLHQIVLKRQGFEPQVSLWQRLRKFNSYVFSLFLDLLAGYGYRPGRSIVSYLVIIFGFMGLYLLNSHFATPHLRWDEALVLSVSSFHGRGFFSQNITLGDAYARLAAAEAVVGLLIEISFIVTFTQRFFGK